MSRRFQITRLGILFTIWLIVEGRGVANAQYTLVGSAKNSPQTDCYQLTSANEAQNGAVWYDQPLRLTESFELEYTLNFGNNSTGADGVVMVMQTTGNRVIGSRGAGIGFGGLKPSLGIEFDTHRNASLGDPVADHIAFVRDGISDHRLNAQFASPTPISTTSANLKDGRDHLIRVRWNATTQRISVSVDCVQRVNQFVDLINDVFVGKNEVYWGFTSSTGSSSNVHTVCLLKDIVIRDTVVACRNETVTLVPGVSATGQYEWKPALGLQTPSIRTPTLVATGTQLYTVSYVDRCAVRRTDSILVQVNAPDFSLGADRKVCENEVIELNPQLTTPTALRYRWSTGDTTRRLTPKTSGLYSLEITADGCSEKDSVLVTFVPLPKLDSLAETVFNCPGDQPLLLDPRATGSGLRYQWTANGASEPTLQTSLPGRYTVRISTDSACTVEKAFVVLDNCPSSTLVFVPDAFTPNGDGVNDVFSWKNTTTIDARMTIINRWGEVVFFSETAGEYWDGTCKGVPCPINSYAWQLEYRSPQRTDRNWFVQKGTVYLMR